MVGALAGHIICRRHFQLKAFMCMKAHDVEWLLKHTHTNTDIANDVRERIKEIYITFL